MTLPDILKDVSFSFGEICPVVPSSDNYDVLLSWWNKTSTD